MPDLLDYAALSAYVYGNVRGDLSVNPMPSGWTQIAYYPGGGIDGFTAGAYRNGVTGEIVIAYKGTDTGLNTMADIAGTVDDMLTDLALGAGLGSTQLFHAAQFYEEVKALNNGIANNITFTGHSLGGGLASVMSVWFNRPAKTFDEAPFEVTALNPLLMAAVSAYLGGLGYSDSDLVKFSFTYLWNYAVRESHVAHYYTQGEFLADLRAAWPTVMGSDSPIVIGGGETIDGLTLHSMNLAASLLMADDFRTDTLLLPNLLPLIFDENLYARDLAGDQRDFLTSLLNDQIKQGYANPNGLLARFADDVQDILSAGGAALSDEQLNKGLIALAIQAYYEQDGGFTQEIYKPIAGGLQIDKSALTTGLDATKSYQQYLQGWLQEHYSADMDKITEALPSAELVYLATQAGMTADAEKDKAALMLGGTGADTLTGGDLADTLIGGAGNDILEGGQGDDTLMGGEGHDTYIWNSGDGSDHIKDSDGQGHIEIRQADGSTQILGGQLIKEESGNAWKSADGKLTLSQSDGWTLTTQDGASLTLDQYSDGDFGLDLKDTPPKAGQPNKTLTGDKKGKDHNKDKAGIQYRYDGDGNLVATEEEETDRRDYLAGAYGRNDQIEGKGGNDFIDADEDGYGANSDDLAKGGDGDDIIWGNEGKDKLEGNEGRDWLDGGPGDDKLYADKEGKVGDANAQTGGSGQSGDWLDGGEGDDTLIGDKNDDLLMGGPGKDILAGGAGDDTLYGGWGVDYTAVQAYHPESDQEPDKPTKFPELEWSVKRDIENGDTYTTKFEITKATSFVALDFFKETDDTQGDTLYGGAGDDWIMAGEGDDYAEGGDGDDAAFGEAGDDILNGGAGKDVLVGDDPDKGDPDSLPGARHGDDALSGGEGDDRLSGNGGNDMLSGGAGSDTLQGDDSATPGQYRGDDTLDGGEGDDKLWGQGGDDVLAGGAGDDHIEGDYSELDASYHGDDLLDGGDGNDTLVGQGGDDFLSGGKGSDQMWGDGPDATGDDMLDGGEGDDILYGGGGDDFLTGGEDNDQIGGDEDEDDPNGGADIIDGGAGDDLLLGYGGDDIIDGGDGHDQVGGGHGADQLSGGAGDDQIAGDVDENDTQGGNDVIDGGAGNDLICGYTGNDMISGGEGDDMIGGGEGDDWLDGGAGNNVIDGGGGNDIMVGGEGGDTYYYRPGDGIDHIKDAGGNDRLVLQLATRFDLNDPDYRVKMYNAIQQIMRLSVGSMLLQFEDGGAIHIDDFDPENPYGPEGIEWFQFDQMVLSKKELIDLLEFDIEGTPGADVLSGTALEDCIVALEGDDVVYGLGGADSVFLGDGNDWADGGEGGDYLSGDIGNDTLLGDGGGDWLYGGEGDDQLAGDAGADTLYGEDGNDLLAGGTGADELYGDEGDDLLAGGAWDDSLYGGAGNDTYEYAAGWGNDTAYAGPGSDTIRLTGLALNDIQLHREGDDLLVFVNADKGVLYAVDWFGVGSGFGQLETGDGNMLDRVAVEANLYVNAQPLTAPDIVAVTEHGVAKVTGNVLDNDSDDHSVQGPGVVTSTYMSFIGPVSTYSYSGKLTVENAGTYQGSYGTLSLGKDGNYTYVLDAENPNVQALGAGQTLDDYFGYTVSDNDPWYAAWSWEQIHVTVNGENDPPFSAADTMLLQEDVTLEASGNVLDNDADPDAGTTLAVLNPGTYAGTYGTLTLAADGAYTYVLANDTPAVQSLGRFEPTYDTLSAGWDVFSYEVSDGTSSIPDVQIVVEVRGTNDAPVLNLPAPDQTVEAGADWTFAQPDGMFGDIDTGDTLRYDYQVGSPDGAPTDWINCDQETGTFSGTAPDGAVGTIEITVVADDGIHFGEGGEVPGEDASDTFTLTLSQPEVVPDPITPDTPDPVDTPVVETTVGVIDPTEPPVELPPGAPGTPGDEPVPTDILIPDGGTTGGGTGEVSDSRTLNPTVAVVPVPVEAKPRYSVHIHAPVTDEDGGGTCDCHDTDGLADPLLAGVAPDLVYGEGWTLNGGGEPDLLVGEAGDDQLGGGGGDDMLIGGLGRDCIQGQDGDDQIAGDKGGLDEAGDDDFIDGGSGNDLIAGQGGNDTLIGGEGDDVMDGGEGHDLLDAGEGADRLQGGAGCDWLRGEDGDDVLFGETGGDLLDGGEGKDTLLGGSGEDHLIGGEGSDTLLGGDCTDAIEGNAGDDEISGGTGHDRIDGGEGDDKLFGDGCNDTLAGGAGKDQLQGGTGLDQLDGGDGDDVLFGEDDNDVLKGGAGDDYLEGDSAEAELMGDDTLDGGDGNDTLLGNAGKDELLGGAGDDRLQGGAGDDLLQGGEGDDVYFIAAGHGVDHVADSGGSDWLVLEDMNRGDIVDFDAEAGKLVFKDGGELYLDDLNPSDLMAEGGIEYIQFADETVMSRQALIQEFVPPPASTPGEQGTGAKNALSDAGQAERSESDIARDRKAAEMEQGIQWFISAPRFQEQSYPDLTRLAASSNQGSVASAGGADTMAQWLAMDATLAAHLAREGAANDADGGAGAGSTVKFLGSTTPWGRDQVSLAVSGSDIPKTFHGLNEGFGRVAG